MLNTKWCKAKSTRILNDFKLIRQKDMASVLNESQQVISYRLKNVYPKMMPELLQMLDMAGYEIKKKEI